VRIILRKEYGPSESENKVLRRIFEAKRERERERETDSMKKKTAQ
jgi:hypothetical protein